MIADRDVAFYRDHGYVVAPDVLDRSTLERARAQMVAIYRGTDIGRQPTGSPAWASRWCRKPAASSRT
jgi:hypothetical protein